MPTLAEQAADVEGLVARLENATLKKTPTADVEHALRLVARDMGLPEPGRTRGEPRSAWDARQSLDHA